MELMTLPMLKRFPTHPVAVSLVPVLDMYSRNMADCPFADVIRPALFSVAAGICFWLLQMLLLRSVSKAALLTTASVLYLHYSTFFGPAIVQHSSSGAIGAGVVLLVAPVVLYLLLLFALLRTSSQLPVMTAYFNWLGWGLAAALALAILWNFQQRQWQSPQATIEPQDLRRIFGGDLPIAEPRVGGPSPDIYYIVLDGYARQDILKESFGWDNSEFSDWLAQKGFQVLGQSSANYCQTALSLVSSLNMDYLDRFAAEAGPLTNDRQLLHNALLECRLFDFLRQQGYGVVALRSGYWPTEITTADLYLRASWGVSELEAVLLENSTLGVLFQAATGISGYDNHRSTVRFALNRLQQPIAHDSPTFLFAHIVCPHPPFAFGPDGRSVRPPGPFRLSDGRDYYHADQYRHGYLDQLQFVNASVRRIVENILSTSSRPAIIVIQADHGPGMNWDPWSLGRTNVRERLGILNAIYMPPEMRSEFRDDSSPVNTFRTVLRTVFGVSIDPLPDRAFYSTWDQPLSFIDVTHAVGQSPE